MFGLALKSIPFAGVTLAERALGPDVTDRDGVRSEPDGTRQMLIMYDVIWARRSIQNGIAAIERTRWSRSGPILRSAKGHFRTEKLDLPRRILGNLTVQPSVLIYLPRSGTNQQPPTRTAPSFLSVTHDFAQGFCLFGVLISLWLHVSRGTTERLPGE